MIIYKVIPQLVTDFASFWLIRRVTYMDPKMSLEIASFLEISQAFDKWTEKWLFSATSALCLFISLIDANTGPCEEVLEALTRRGAFVG